MSQPHREFSYTEIMGDKVVFDPARLPLLLIVKHTPDDQLQQLAEKMGLDRREYRYQVKHHRPSKGAGHVEPIPA